MPALEIRDLYQRAILWQATGGYDHYGRPLTNPPVQIAVRWITKKREVLDRNGNTIALEGQLVVAQTIPIGSLIWTDFSLTPLVNWYGTGSAGSDNGVCEVKTDDTTPDIKNRNMRRTYGFMKFMSNPTAANT